MDFKLVSSYKPCGDQPQAIESLAEGLENGFPHKFCLVSQAVEKLLLWQTLLRDCNAPHL